MVSIEEIYKNHSQMIYRYLLSLTHNVDIAEDLTQETFYCAIKGIERFDEKCKVSTWLCAIAKNLWCAYLRKNPEHQELSESCAVGKSAEDDVLEKLGHMDILKRIHKLNEQEREVMHLRLFGNLSFREIGEITGKSENWARVTFYRAKVQIRKEIGDNE